MEFKLTIQEYRRFFLDRAHQWEQELGGATGREGQRARNDQQRNECEKRWYQLDLQSPSSFRLSFLK